MSKLSQEIKECVSCPQINGKPYGRWGALNSQQRIKIWNLAHQCEVFESVADDTVKELAKYKRAFEILKGVLCLDKDTSLDGKVVFYTLYFSGEIPYENYERLGKEDYELLEELLK